MGTDIHGVYISKDGLPGDLLGNLESLSVNAGSAFLSGEAAKLLSKPSNIVDNSMLIYNTVTDVNTINKVTKDLIEHSVTVVTNELSSYLVDKTTELLSLHKMNDVLMNSISYWTEKSLLKPSEILEKIQKKSVEDTNKEESEKAKNEKFEKIKEKTSYCVGVCKDYMQKTIDSLDCGIETITTYVTLGPDWIVTQVNSYVSQAIEKAEGFIGTYTDYAIKTRDAAIDLLAKGVGKAAAATTNGILLLQAKKNKSEVEQKISDGIVKAQNKATMIIMKLRELTGAVIPVIYPPLNKLSKLF